MIQNISRNLPRNGVWPTRRIVDIEDITVHHSASPTSGTPYSFAKFHTSSKIRGGKGWPQIAYHYVIAEGGEIYQCLPLDAHSSHNGFNNKKAIGICLIGNFEEHDVPALQRQALEWLILDLKTFTPNQSDIALPNLKYLMGHREYKGSTLCPGKHLPIEPLRQLTNLAFRDTIKKRQLRR